MIVAILREVATMVEIYFNQNGFSV